MSDTASGATASLSKVELPPGATTKIFIDGQAGTTGLDMRERLLALPRFELLEIEEHQRKDNKRRQELIEEADIAVLCLPDSAAIEAAELASSSTTRLSMRQRRTGYRLTGPMGYRSCPRPVGRKSPKRDW